jgi:hypothetical protein
MDHLPIQDIKRALEHVEPMLGHRRRNTFCYLISQRIGAIAITWPPRLIMPNATLTAGPDVIPPPSDLGALAIGRHVINRSDHALPA